MEDLKARLEGYGWKIKQPLEGFPEVMVIESALKPGELGKTKEFFVHYNVPPRTSVEAINYCVNDGYCPD